MPEFWCQFREHRRTDYLCGGGPTQSDGGERAKDPYKVGQFIAPNLLKPF